MHPPCGDFANRLWASNRVSTSELRASRYTENLLPEAQAAASATSLVAELERGECQLRPEDQTLYHSPPVEQVGEADEYHHFHKQMEGARVLKNARVQQLLNYRSGHF